MTDWETNVCRQGFKKEKEEHPIKGNNKFTFRDSSDSSRKQRYESLVEKNDSPSLSSKENPTSQP